MNVVPRRRSGALLLVVLVALAGLAVRLVDVQAVNAEEYGALARRQRVRSVVLPAPRGTIYDRDRNELALSVPARTVYANPKQIHDAEGVARIISPILGVPVPELLDRLRRPKGFVYLARRVDVAKAARVESLKIPGLGAVEESRRTYPGGSLAASVVGFVGTDATGLAGVEAAYEPLLRGRPGRRVLELDPHGRAIPQGVFHEEEPVAGSGLVLTIDEDIQFAAEHALQSAVEQSKAKGGTVVALDPRSGDVLAMANLPTFDPNRVEDIADPAVTRNRAVTDAYEPGSANKLVTAAAALEAGVVTPQTPFGVPSTITIAGTPFSDAHGHATKTMTFTDIIAQSSNVGTIKVAMKLGPRALEDGMRAFGYGRATGLGFPGESAGILPRADRWNTSLPTMAIGQGVSVTALQIVRAFATVANDGVAVEPRLVGGWIDGSGRMHPAPSSRRRRVVRTDTAAAVRQMLTEAVSDGTGTLAQIPGYPTAGKTGTAQKVAPEGGYRGYIASFIGMAPADHPRVVIGVVLDDPSPIWGGVVAAPVFREVGLSALRIMRVPPGEASVAGERAGSTLAVGEGSAKRGAAGMIEPGRRGPP